MVVDGGKSVEWKTHHFIGMTIEADACLLGWGVALGGVLTGGLWMEEERRHHINRFELQGGTFVVKTFAKGKTNIHKDGQHHGSRIHKSP